MSNLTEYQENITYNSNGAEEYRGLAPVASATSDANWVISKCVYTPTNVNGVTVDLLTHISFLRGRIWNDRASISFP